MVGFQARARKWTSQPLLGRAPLANALERSSRSGRGAQVMPLHILEPRRDAPGRILDPVMYTRGGRFHHDPAEWSPILRATKRFTMPGLSKAEALPDLRGTPEHGSWWCSRPARLIARGPRCARPRRSRLLIEWRLQCHPCPVATSSPLPPRSAWLRRRRPVPQQPCPGRPPARRTLNRTRTRWACGRLSDRPRADVPELRLHHASTRLRSWLPAGTLSREGEASDSAGRDAAQDRPGAGAVCGTDPCRPEEIGFLFSTSEGENMVANALDLKAGDNIVIDDLHYETEFVLYRHLQDTQGRRISRREAPRRPGRCKDFEALVNRRTRLVSVAWVSHHNGFRHDMRPIADLAHANGALFYVDGIQAVGMFPTDVKAEGVDLLCAGTYKWLLGGFGVAPFYVRRDLLDRIRLDRYGALHVERELGDGRFRSYRTAKRFDYATLPFAEVYQLGAGLAYVTAWASSGSSSTPSRWPTSFVRASRHRAIGCSRPKQPLVDRHLLLAKNAATRDLSLRTRPHRRDRSRRLRTSAGVSGALQHARRHRAVPRGEPHARLTARFPSCRLRVLSALRVLLRASQNRSSRRRPGA